MEVKLPRYWFFKNVLSKEKCQYIIKDAKKNYVAATVKTKYTKKDLKKIRSTSVTFLRKQYLFDLINTYLPIANKNGGWNYEHSIIEPVQLAHYKPGDHYAWHQDGENRPYGHLPGAPNFEGLTRKLTMAVNLSDPKDYKGGGFEFWFGSPYSAKEVKGQGSLVFFPSNHWHRITPVLSGTRYSLVAWVLGKPFK